MANKFRKGSSVVKEMQFKNHNKGDTILHLYDDQKDITNFGKDVEKFKPLSTVSGDVKWCSYFST